jgi:hypothetical protein
MTSFIKILIFLNFIFCTGYAVAQSYPVTDSFIGSGVLTAPWSQGTASQFTSTCSKSSTGLITTATNSMCSIAYTGATFTANQYAQVTMTSTYLGVANNTGPCVRCTAAGNGYVWLPADGFVAVYVNGTYSGSVIGSTPSVSPGDTIKLSVSGSTVAATNITTGMSTSGTDTQLTTGSPGFWLDETGGGGNTNTTPTNFQGDCFPSTCGALALPTFSPGSGSYSMSVTVTITPPSGATACYTTDGTMPTATTPGTCSHGTAYRTALTFTTATTVKAISTQSGQTNSSLASASYTVTVPTVHYIRTDGGTSTQCDGLTNAALAGAVSNHCALSHPFYLVTDNTTANAFSWSFANPNSGGNFNGGDTIQFEDQGPYYLGLTLNGLGISWLSCAGDAANCVLPSLPSGTSAHPTRVYGANVGSCHDSGHTQLNNPTVLSLLNDSFWGLSLANSNYTDVECIEITQPDTCNVVGGGSTPIVKTSLTGGVASYVYYDQFGNPPLLTQIVNITGTTNGSGRLNLSNVQVASLTDSVYAITGSQATDANTAVFNWTLVSGNAPRVGDNIFSITGTTNGGGQFNTQFGWEGSSITAVTGTTSGTFTVTRTDSGFTVVAFQTESGAATDFLSGTFTVNGVSGSDIAAATDSGNTSPVSTCVQGVNNYGTSGIVFESGIGIGPSNATLADIAVAGLGSDGLLGSCINCAAGGGTMTASDIYVIGNGSAGWDSDGGGCNTSCESIGTMNLDHITVQFNGCNVVKPFVWPLSNNTYNYCYDQGNQGYGDGFSFIAAGNVSLNVTNSNFSWNTQDGFDSLHLSDDITKSPSVSIMKSWAEGNEGQSIKLGAGTTATAINNVSIANCRVLGTASNFPTFPAGWNAGLGLTCRADGDEWTFQINNGTTVTLQFNTSVGYGATMYDIGCASGGTCTTGTKFIFENNISVGYPDPDGGALASGFYIGVGTNPFDNIGSLARNNLWFNMRNGCPDPSTGETNYVCANPLLVNPAINSIDPHLQSGSPAIGVGITISGVTTDYDGDTRPNPPAIGAFEYVLSGNTGFVINSAFGFAGIIQIQ